MNNKQNTTRTAAEQQPAAKKNLNAEIRALAASGSSAQQIAEQLKLNLRHVQNTLWRAARLKRASLKQPAAQPAAEQSKAEPASIKVSQPAAAANINMSEILKARVPQSVRYIPRKLNKNGMTDLDFFKSIYLKNMTAPAHERENILISGETSTGKTTALREFAAQNGLPYFRLSCSAATTPAEVIGHVIADSDGRFKWCDGIITIMARYGGVLVLDEINMMSEDMTSALHSLLDAERQITLSEHNNEVIKAHDGLLIAATINPDYAGCKEMNKAFTSRFTTKLIYDYDSKIEKALIKNANILELAKKLRAMKKCSELESPTGTRNLMAFERHINDYGEEFAITMFLNDYAASEREPINNVIELIFNKPVKAAAAKPQPAEKNA